MTTGHSDIRRPAGLFSFDSKKFPSHQDAIRNAKRQVESVNPINNPALTTIPHETTACQFPRNGQGELIDEPPNWRENAQLLETSTSNRLIGLAILCFADVGFRRRSRETNAEWGTLTGRFIYDGVPPKREPVELNKDLEFCGPLKPLDEELIVDPKSRGLKNVVLWLEPKSDEPPPVHPAYQKIGGR